MNFDAHDDRPVIYFISLNLIYLILKNGIHHERENVIHYIHKIYFCNF